MYRFFDFLIESNIPLPELPEVETGIASISFHLLAESLPNQQIDWFHHWRLPDGEITISCARDDCDYYLRFPELADFKIEDGCNDIHCNPCAGISDSMVRHLLLDQVVPRVASHHGEIVLHASAVVMNDTAIVFLGETGRGKSTLAASFHMNGYPLLTDDCLLLRQEGSDVIGIPSYAGARLWADSYDAVADEKQVSPGTISYSPKKQIILNKNVQIDNDKMPIRAIFTLSSKNRTINSEKIKIEKITGAEIIIDLTTHSFVLDVADIKKAEEKFFNMGQAAKADMSFYHLSYPHDHTLLDSLRNEIIKVVAGD